MSDAFELEICQGKYRYRYEGGKQEVWRNGDTWPAMNEKLIGDKFVFSLAVELDEALKERDALRVKVERMEKQEPVARFNWNKGKLEWLRPWNYSIMNMKPLYLAPGAQPAPSVPDADELAHFIRRIDGAHDLGASALAEKIVDWLAAAQEAKP